MKILNVHIDEYTTNIDLMDMLKEYFDDNFRLVNSKSKAINELKSQTNSDIRVFYSIESSINESDYVHLYEVLFD
jgi:hypothetical protein